MKLKLASSIVALAVFGWLGRSAPAHAVVFNDIFIFGDSYSDTGAFFPLTNGGTAASYLAADLGIPLVTSKSANPGTSGVNFAETGARVAVTPPSGSPRSLALQVQEFQSYLSNNLITFNPATTLFFLSGGLNDHPSSSSPSTTSADVNAAYSSEVATLYALGARYFEIALLPSKVPAFADSANTLNPGYKLLVPQLAAQYPNASITLSNWGPFYDDILINPGKYGITNTTDPCSMGFPTPTSVCSNPNQYFYYIIVHPSDAAHHIVGDELYQEALAIQLVPEPLSLAILGTGVAGLWLTRRRKQG